VALDVSIRQTQGTLLRVLRAWTGRELLVGAVLLIAFFAHLIYLACVAEDAFITFRFARHLAEGHGLIWNIGEPPVEGYTNFLWVVLCAAAMKLGIDVPRFAQALGAIAAVATGALLYLLTRRESGESRTGAFVATLLLAASGPFATWAGSGMETVGFAALVFAAFFFLAAWWRTERPRTLLACHLACFGATLTRPEGLMVFVLIAGLGILLAPSGWQRALRAHIAPLAAFAALFGIYFAWRLSYFGYPLPNTFYAKTSGSIDQVSRGVRQVAAFAIQFVLPLAPAAAIGLWRAGFTASGSTWMARLRAYRAPLAAAMIAGVYGSYVAAVGGDYMAMHRFLVPVLPFIYFLVGCVIAFALRETGRSQVFRSVAAAAVVLAVAGTITHSTPYGSRFTKTTPWAHGNWEGVQTERWHAARLALLGRYFAGLRPAEPPSIGTDAIGALAYYANVTVFDIHGLVDPVIAHRSETAVGAGRPGHERDGLLHVLTKRPLYLMFNRQLTRQPVERWGVSPEALTVIQEQYVPRSVRMDDPVNGQSGWFNYLERK
jgi:arabinofuranosyltransferase